MNQVRYGREVEDEFVSAVDLYRKAIVYQYNDVNKLIKYPSERIRHFLAKSILFYRLRRIRHDVITEFTIEGIGTGDLFDLNTRTQYEIETEKSIANINKMKTKYIQTGIDLVIIQIKKMPNDINGMENYIEPFIHPD